ncbi:sister chromatid cohesion protein PDS5 homolog C-like isoform X1 [Primulina tabacum]|uniref:sister chromatid cohesion protein PDS5 homolog C-like isoform X1 n=1 Tax=Primulina tabacum TaxID=48773 RepID=UPI003F5A8DA4
MPTLSDMELEEQLTAAGNALSQPPSSLDELLRLLDRIEELLSKVEQSPAKSMLTALSPLMDALITEYFLKHSDVDVKVGVASCVGDITRITAPDAPYDDDKMKDVFHLIVSSFEDLSDTSSRSHHKRASILETVAKVRSCVIMLDLECDQMIIEMFQHFLKAIRVHHSEIIFASMETIMTLVIEESEDISSDLLNPILDTLKRNNKEVLPIAKKLAEKVIQNCAQKLRPYLTQALKTSDTNFDDYSGVVASTCEPNASTVGHSNENISKYQKVAKEGSAETPVLDKDAPVTRSPKSISSINEIMTEETIPDAHYSNMADSSRNVEDKSMSKNVSNDLGARKPKISGLKVETDAKRKGRQFKPDNNLAVSSDLLDDQKQNEQVPCHQDIAAKDGSPDEILSVEADISLDNVNDVSIHPLRLKALEKEDINLASSTQSPGMPADSRSKKAGRANRKENLGTKETKKALEGTDILKAKQQRCSLKKKSDKTIDKDKVLAEEVLSKNDHMSTSDSEARSLDPTEKLGDASNKVDDGSSLSQKEVGKKGAQKKPESLKFSSKEDHGQDMVASPRIPLKSSKNEDSVEETKRMSNKRKRSPGIQKTSETKEYGEELVGSKVKVWWPKDQMFYEGVISSFDSVKKKHMVLYNDGDKEVLNLGRERWELVGDDSFATMGKSIEHSSPDASSDMRRKKKGFPISELSSKRRKIDGSLKSKSTSSGKLKDVKSGGKSGSKFKDDGKAELKSKSNSKSSGKSIADPVEDKNPQKHRGKSHDDSAKTSGRSGDDVAKTSSHSKPDRHRNVNSKGNTPQSGRSSSVNGTGTAKSSLSKSKETDHIKGKTTDLAKSQESIRGKSPDSAKSQESETKAAKKRRR